MNKYTLQLITISILLFGLLVSVSAQTQLGGDIDGESAGDWSGSSVSMSSDGTKIAIGAHNNDGNGVDSGHTRVYELSGGTWIQVGSDIDGEAEGDFSGYSVSLSSDGNRIAIGAIKNDDGGENSGHVRVLEWSGGTWTQLGSDINGEATEDRSGWAVSLSSDGNRVAIGAPRNGGFTGHVRVFEWSGGTWTQLGSDIDGEAANDWSGNSVALSNDGNRIAIGGYHNNDNGNLAGQVRVYELSGGVWTQLGGDIDGEAAGDLFGFQVAISADGSKIASGAPSNDNANGTGSGHVRVFELSGGVWNQVGDDIDGEAADDGSGISVSMSSDGNKVAIGARGNDGNGSQSGHVRLYELNGGVWTQLGQDIDGEAPGDLSGHSVPMSSDGSTIASGAYNNDGNGTAAGHVRVFENNGPLPVSFVSFVGAEENSTVNLYWTTANEFNNQGFELEHSLNGLNWQKITFIEGKNTSNGFINYFFNHRQAVSGRNYYRLKQIDFGGDVEYSDVISVMIPVNQEIVISPNPTNGKIEIYGIKEGKLKVINNFGRIVKEINYDGKGLNLSELSSGIYFIHISSASYQNIVRIIKL